jgi:hypothetical protein
MSATTWILSPVVGTVVLAVVVTVLVQRRRRRQLRELFGPDYDRGLGSTGVPAEDAAPLPSPERDRRVLRPLGPAESHSFRMEWQRVQASFVDRPALAVHEADALLTAVFLARGIPAETFERPASSLTSDYAGTAQRYHTAQTVHLRADSSETTTDELRTAFVQYRELFDELTSEGGSIRPDESQGVRR